MDKPGHDEFAVRPTKPHASNAQRDLHMQLPCRNDGGGWNAAPGTDLPDGASPSRKNISVFQKRNSVYELPVSPA
ncbi:MULTISPECIES: hypothetical protein [unclassified Bradyrhizobium]|uniref:hypothetical protein n=1 Tax=unclassified Bradyrhizobium TaxID=2631580 RepID=UPI002479767D|nr:MULTISPECIES: hypothetical protein [unclassified Bradyrhizobium]WGS21444.1 hypothetical protein MTX22_06885 [Bradyrhizobium sp. ISRA463]WGS28378.1 hypothetical protein MTX19_04730 [Bradyrhizobium sp. ISRA464]